MKISYSRYSAFVRNQEKYRLYYELGLTPEGDETPTMYNLGRRRGQVFHALQEGRDRAELVAMYGPELVRRAEAMVEVTPAMEMDWIERSFEIPILDGKHSIIGRIDHRFVNRDGNRQPGDFKTTKGTRTKKETVEYFQDLEESLQHHFYLKAELVFSESPTGLFTYHVIFDRKDKDSKPRYVPLEIPYIGPAEIERTMSSVYAACEEIEAMREYGREKPWPLGKWTFFDDAYRAIAGRTIPKGAVPAGFTSRFKEVIQTEEV